MDQDGRSNTQVNSEPPVTPTASDDDDEPPNIFRPGWRFYSSISVFMAMTLLESASSNSTSTALTTLTTKIKGTSAQYEWIGNAYMLAAGVLQLPVSALSNVFGRVPLVIASFTLFLGGSLACALALNIQTLLAGRTLQGIGGAGTLVLPEIFLADVVPLRLRGYYYSLLSIMWSLGSALGPVMGGGFSVAGEYMWRWIFWINVPICGITLLGTPWAVRLAPPPLTLKEKLRSIDYGGIVLVISSTTSFILALSMGGASYPWSSYQVLVPLCLGAAGFGITVLYESRIPEYPLISMCVFGKFDAFIGIVHVTVQGVIMEGLPYWLPIYYQGVKGYSPLVSGLALLPLAAITFASSVVSGFVTSKTGRYLFISLVGWSILTLGLGLLLLLDEESSPAVWVGITVPIALGLGSLYALQGTIVQAPNPPNLWTDAAAAMSFCRSIGEALGVALGGSIFTSRMTQLVSEISDISSSIDESQPFRLIEVIKHLPVLSRLRNELQHAMVESMRSIYTAFVALAAFSLVLHVFMTEYSLDKLAEPRQGIVYTSAEGHEEANKEVMSYRTKGYGA